MSKKKPDVYSVEYLVNKTPRNRRGSSNIPGRSRVPFWCLRLIIAIILFVCISVICVVVAVLLTRPIEDTIPKETTEDEVPIKEALKQDNVDKQVLKHRLNSSSQDLFIPGSNRSQDDPWEKVKPVIIPKRIKLHQLIGGSYDEEVEVDVLEIIIPLPKNVDPTSQLFKEEVAQALAEGFKTGEKRNHQPLSRRKRQITEDDIEIVITNITLQDNGQASVDFYVVVNGVPVPGNVAVETFSSITNEELSEYIQLKVLESIQQVPSLSETISLSLGSTIYPSTGMSVVPTASDSIVVVSPSADTTTLQPTVTDSIVIVPSSIGSVSPQPTATDSIEIVSSIDTVSQQPTASISIIEPTVSGSDGVPTLSIDTVSLQPTASDSVVIVTPSQDTVSLQPTASDSVVIVTPSLDTVSLQPTASDSVVIVTPSLDTVSLQPTVSDSVVIVTPSLDTVSLQPTASDSVVIVTPSLDTVSLQPTASDSVVIVTPTLDTVSLQPTASDSVVIDTPSLDTVSPQPTASDSVVIVTPSLDTVSVQPTASDSVVIVTPSLDTVSLQPTASDSVVIVTPSLDTVSLQPTVSDSVVIVTPSLDTVSLQPTASDSVVIVTPSLDTVSLQPTASDSVVIVTPTLDTVSLQPTASDSVVIDTPSLDTVSPQPTASDSVVIVTPSLDTVSVQPTASDSVVIVTPSQDTVSLQPTASDSVVIVAPSLDTVSLQPTASDSVVIVTPSLDTVSLQPTASDSVVIVTPSLDTVSPQPTASDSIAIVSPSIDTGSLSDTIDIVSETLIVGTTDGIMSTIIPTQPLSTESFQTVFPSDLPSSGQLSVIPTIQPSPTISGTDIVQSTATPIIADSNKLTLTMGFPENYTSTEDPMLREYLKTRITEMYVTGKTAQSQRRKREADDVTVIITDISENNDGNLEVVFGVVENNTPVPAVTAAAIINSRSAEEQSGILGAQVISKATPIVMSQTPGTSPTGSVVITATVDGGSSVIIQTSDILTDSVDTGSTVVVESTSVLESTGVLQSSDIAASSVDVVSSIILESSDIFASSGAFQTSDVAASSVEVGSSIILESSDVVASSGVFQTSDIVASSVDVVSSIILESSDAVASSGAFQTSDVAASSVEVGSSIILESSDVVASSGAFQTSDIAASSVDVDSSIILESSDVVVSSVDVASSIILESSDVVASSGTFQSSDVVASSVDVASSVVIESSDAASSVLVSSDIAISSVQSSDQLVTLVTPSSSLLILDSTSIDPTPVESSALNTDLTTSSFSLETSYSVPVSTGDQMTATPSLYPSDQTIIATPTSSDGTPSVQPTSIVSSSATVPPFTANNLLRIVFRVNGTTDINSEAFRQQIANALRRAYLQGSLRMGTESQRRRREVTGVDPDETSIQIAKIFTEGGNAGVVHFYVDNGGDRVPAGEALPIFKQLSLDELTKLLQLELLSHVEIVNDLSMSTTNSFSSKSDNFFSSPPIIASSTSDISSYSFIFSSDAQSIFYSTHLSSDIFQTVSTLSSGDMETTIYLSSGILETSFYLSSGMFETSKMLSSGVMETSSYYFSSDVLETTPNFSSGIMETSPMLSSGVMETSSYYFSSDVLETTSYFSSVIMETSSMLSSEDMETISLVFSTFTTGTRPILSSTGSETSVLETSMHFSSNVRSSLISSNDLMTSSFVSISQTQIYSTATSNFLSTDLMSSTYTITSIEFPHTSQLISSEESPSLTESTTLFTSSDFTSPSPTTSISVPLASSTPISVSTSLTTSVSVSPSLTTSVSVSPSLTTSVSVSPSLTTSVSVSPSLTTSVSVSPSLTTSVSVSPSLTTSVSVSPSLTTSVSVSPSLTTSVSVSPSLTTSVSVSPSLTTSVSVSPSPTTSISVSPSLTTSVSVSPSLTTSVSVSPSLTMSVSVSPSLTTSVSVSPSLTTSVSVSPSLTTSVSVSPSFTTSVSVSPSLTTSVLMSPSLTTSVSVSPISSTLATTSSFGIQPTSTITTTPATIITTPSPTTNSPNTEDSLCRMTIQVKTNVNETTELFKNSIETGLEKCYIEAAIFLNRRRRRETQIQNSDGTYVIAAEVTDVKRESSDPKEVSVDFNMVADNQVIAAEILSSKLNKLSLAELSSLMAYPVLDKVYPVSSLVDPEPENDVGVILAIVIPSLIIIVLIVAFIIYLCRNESIQVGTTLPKESDNLGDHNLDVDIESGDIVKKSMTWKTTPSGSLALRKKSTPLAIEVEETSELTSSHPTAPNLSRSSSFERYIPYREPSYRDTRRSRSNDRKNKIEEEYQRRSKDNFKETRRHSSKKDKDRTKGVKKKPRVPTEELTLVEKQRVVDEGFIVPRNHRAVDKAKIRHDTRGLEEEVRQRKEAKERSVIEEPFSVTGDRRTTDRKQRSPDLGTISTSRKPKRNTSFSSKKFHGLSEAYENNAFDSFESVFQENDIETDSFRKRLPSFGDQPTLKRVEPIRFFDPCYSPVSEVGSVQSSNLSHRGPTETMENKNGDEEFDPNVFANIAKMTQIVLQDRPDTIHRDPPPVKYRYLPPRGEDEYNTKDYSPQTTYEPDTLVRQPDTLARQPDISRRDMDNSGYQSEQSIERVYQQTNTLVTSRAPISSFDEIRADPRTDEAAQSILAEKAEIERWRNKQRDREKLRQFKLEKNQQLENEKYKANKLGRNMRARPRKVERNKADQVESTHQPLLNPDAESSTPLESLYFAPEGLPAYSTPSGHMISPQTNPLIESPQHPTQDLLETLNRQQQKSKVLSRPPIDDFTKQQAHELLNDTFLLHQIEEHTRKQEQMRKMNQLLTDAFPLARTEIANGDIEITRIPNGSFAAETDEQGFHRLHENGADLDFNEESERLLNDRPSVVPRIPANQTLNHNGMDNNTTISSNHGNNLPNGHVLSGFSPNDIDPQLLKAIRGELRNPQPSKV